MTVADKTDGVCGAANQGPEDGPSSPRGRVLRLVLDSHPSRPSAASESTPNGAWTLATTILNVWRWGPHSASRYTLETMAARSPASRTTSAAIPAPAMGRSRPRALARSDSVGCTEDADDVAPAEERTRSSQSHTCKTNLLKTRLGCCQPTRNAETRPRRLEDGAALAPSHTLSALTGEFYPSPSSPTRQNSRTRLLTIANFALSDASLYYQCRLTDCPRSYSPGGQKHQPLRDGQQRAREWSKGYKAPAFDAGRSIRFSWSSDVDSLGLATVSDLKSACKILTRIVLNDRKTAPLTSKSSPALPRVETDVRAPTSNVLERTQRPSRRPPSSPVTPPPSSPSTLAFSTTLPTLLTSLNSTPSTSSSLSWPSLRPRSLNLGACPLDNVADAFNVALLAALDAAIALCVAALIERRRVRLARRTSSSATTRQHVGDDDQARRRRRARRVLALALALALLSGVGNVGRYWLYRPLTSRLNASCSHAEDSHVDIAARTGLVDIALRAGLIEREGVSVKGRRRSVGEGKAKQCR
ncbi:hypothetical protein FB107DRAFT_280300 [Schizophyllum commune]